MQCPTCGSFCTIDPASGALESVARVILVGDGESPGTCATCGAQRKRAMLTSVSLDADGSISLGWMEALGVPERDTTGGGWN